MSRLDFVTIIIVSICILAIIFLVYKMTDLFAEEETPTTTELPANTDDYNNSEEDSLYIDDYDDSFDTTAVTTTDDAEMPDDAYTGEEDIDYSDEEEETPVETFEEPVRTRTDGKYLVIAGTFKIRQNADNFVTRLNGMGYPNAEATLFDKGTYAVVIADRTDDLTDAKTTAKELTDKLGLEVYVKVTQGEQ